MKIVGLITEYNPFHNGHAYHIEEAKRITGADYVIVVMSGNFVQRGDPAVIDKYYRTQMALENNADLVFELPVCYATGSAEFFAHGAVALLHNLGVIDYLCFGSECGDIHLLQHTAKLLNEMPASFKDKIYDYLREGLTYPAARQKAFLYYQTELIQPDTLSNLDSMTRCQDAAAISNLLNEPNNILGIEYMKAIDHLSSNMVPITIKRQLAHYHDTGLGKETSDQEAISSASAIRKAIDSSNDESGLTNAKNSLPKAVYQILMENYNINFPISVEDFSILIKYKLLSESSNSLTSYSDITNDLADRMKNIRQYNLSISQLAIDLKTKNLTLTRIQRSLIHLLLNIRSTSLQDYMDNGYVFYARLLGMKKESSHLLQKIEESKRIPIIKKLSKAKEQLNPLGLQMLSEDIFAAELYHQAVYEKYHTAVPNEYRHGIVIV